MEISARTWVTWATAFMVVFAFYAHAIVGLPSSAVTPISAGVIAGLLGLGALLDLQSPGLTPPTSPMRRVSAWCLALALGGFTLSMLVGLFERGMTINDWGLFAVQAGTPVVLAVWSRRLDLLTAIGAVCVGFAVLDMGANLLAASGVIDLTVYSGRIEDEIYRVRYPGVAGNTHAAGLVAFVAVLWLASGVRGVARPATLGRLVLILALLVSLYLIDARRYLAMTLLSLPLLLMPRSVKIWPPLVAMAVAAAALLATFNTPMDDEENNLRADLLMHGFNEAQDRPFLGQGIFYRDPDGLNASYEALEGAGVTESGALDLAIAYGIPAAALFILSALCAIGAWRYDQPWPAVMLTMMTGELAFGGSLSGFLGATLFYAALLHLQRDDLTPPEHPHVPIRS